MKILQDIDIKYYEDGEAKVRYTAPVTSSAVVHFELMNSHYCKLSFDTAKAVYFQIGDFIETPYGRFELVDTVRPTHDGGTYTYDLQFEAYYRKWKNRIFKYLPKSSNPEASFNLTSNIKVHAQIVIDNLAALAKIDKTFLYDYNYEGDDTDYTFVVDASVDTMEAKALSYTDTNILDALTSIADEFECEWWVEGNIIHFGTCENTNAITDFTINDNVVEMTSSESSSTYATRVFAFGAEKNIPYSYYNDADVDVTKSGVVQRRLMLPTLEECSDANRALLDENGFELTTNGCLQIAGLNPDQYVEGVTTNDDIYPKNTIKVGKVETYKKNVDTENNDGTTTTVERTFYRLKNLVIVNDDGEKTGDMAFRRECILSNKTLHLLFQSGTLNGLDFECAFNPEGASEILYDDYNKPVIIDEEEQINPESQCFEIVANEDYGRFLPDTVLYPKEGDVFVLYNWDATKMSAASEKATKYYANVKSSFSNSVLTLTTDLVWEPSYYTEQTNLKIATGTTYKVRLSVNNVSVYGVIGMVIGRAVFQAKTTWFNETRQNLQEFYEAVSKTGEVYFEAGIDTSTFPNKRVVTSGTKKSSALVMAASNELLTDAIKNLKKSMIDPSTYTCKMDATYAFNNGKGRQFGEGDRINLYNKAFFETYRESRVIGYEIHLDMPFQEAQYTIGEKPSYSKLNAMDSKIEELVFNGQSYIGTSGSGGTSTYIIKSYDSTNPTEYNVYSGRAVDTHFMRKDTEDTATAKQNFEKDIQVEGEALLHGGATFGHDHSIDSEGNAVLGDTKADNVAVETIASKDYERELYKGFSLAKGTNGNYKLEIGDLEVWGKAQFNQLEIRKVSYAGGTTVFSNAGSTLKRVVAVKDSDGTVIAYKCFAVADDGTTQTANWWTVGMMALCQTYNIQAGSYEGSSNRKYWRLVVGKGQEMLEDGKLYDYIILSNVKTFLGGDQTVPVYTEKAWANEDGKIIIFGEVALSHTEREGALGTFASGCDVTKDEGGNDIATRTFYGYQEGSDAPQAEDVIVQVGDQVAWNSKGNLVMISTYNLDNLGNVPAIAMYHAMGNTYADADGNADPYQWQTLTHMASPKKTLVNSDYFEFFTGSVTNVVKPITTTYEIQPSSTFIKKDSSGKASPEDISLTLYKHYGNQVTADETQGIYFNIAIDGQTYTDVPYVDGIINSLQAQSYDVTTLDGITALYAYIWLNGRQMAAFNLAVLQDGANGSSVSIKGTLANTSKLADIKNPALGDGYIISGNLWVYTGNGSVYGFENVGQIKGDPGQSATQYYTYFAWANDAQGSGFTTDPQGKSFAYMGTCVTTDTSAPGTWERYTWAKVLGKQGDNGQNAVDVIVTGAPLVFDTDTDGVVTDLSKSASISLWRKGENVTALAYKTNVASTTNCTATAALSLDGKSIKVTLTSIATQTVEGYTMSQQAGLVVVEMSVDGTVYKANVPFEVNVVKMMGSFKADNKSLKSQYTEIATSTIPALADRTTANEGNIQANTEALGNKANKDDVAKELKEMQSTITQTARDISLEVSEKAIGRRNLLQASACRTGDEGWSCMSGGTSYTDGTPYETVVAGLIDGTSGLHCYSYFNAETDCINAGFDWVGGSAQGNIKVEKGKSYTISFYAKVTDKAKMEAVLETIWQGSATDNTRPAGYAGPEGFSESFALDASNSWQLIKKTISVPKDAEYEYVEVCLFLRATSSIFTDGYLCRPMMEEGSVYNGWTLSTSDTDYVTGGALKKAGIGIDADSVTLYGDQVKVQNGETTAALFQNGKVSATMLDATQIVTDGLQAQTIDAKNATISNLTVNEANVTGKITATTGQIGGLNITANSLTNVGFNSDSYIVMRNDTHDTFVGIGGNLLPSAYANTRAIAQFENCDTTGFTGYNTNFAIIAKASGATDNCALCINGGYIQGLRIKTRTYITACTIERGVNCALLNVEGTFTLPDMLKEDDGYVLYVRHLAPGAAVKIKGGTAVNKDGETKTTFLLAGDVPKTNAWTVGAAGDTVMLVYHRGLTNDSLSFHYEGCWLIMKMPRDW